MPAESNRVERYFRLSAELIMMPAMAITGFPSHYDQTSVSFVPLSVKLPYSYRWRAENFTFWKCRSSNAWENSAKRSQIADWHVSYWCAVSSPLLGFFAFSPWWSLAG